MSLAAIYWRIGCGGVGVLCVFCFGIHFDPRASTLIVLPLILAGALIGAAVGAVICRG